MLIQVPCPHCRAVAAVPDGYAGRIVRCKACDGKIAIPRKAAPELPAAIDRYQIRALLGQGTFGSVYRAFDPRLKRDVALKVLKAEMTASPQAVQRFLREARAAAKLFHPYIVPVFDAGRAGSVYYITSAFIRGKTLASAIPEGGMDPRQAAALGAQLASALGYAHKEGVLHRDVKPANAMLDEQGSLHLMDFGLAGWTQQESTRLTQAGAVMGTPAFMAPEQASGETARAGPLADLYSAGVVLYQMLTDHLPFEGGHPAALVYQIVHTPPPPPSQHRPGLDAALEAVCLKALAKDPAQRYQSGEEMAAALTAWAPTALPLAQPMTPKAVRPTSAWDRETVLPPIRRTETTPMTAPAARRPRKRPGRGRPARPGVNWVLWVFATLAILAGLVGAAVVLHLFPPRPSSSQADSGTKPLATTSAVDQTNPVKPKDPPKPTEPNSAAGENPKEPPPPKPADVPKGAQLFPRRALVISVQNYLYANPVHAGMIAASNRNIPGLLEALNKGLHIPVNEMAHLSDAAATGARPPLKPVIEKTLTDFLDSSRAQDRIMVFFIGHACAIGDDTYLAPIEGEMDNANTLIPLKWVYEQMAKCKARQKVLVMDVHRLNPAYGLERPNGGPMDSKEDAALNAPPEGVQVWTACVAGQQSYELDEAPMGLFLDQLNTALTPNLGRGEKGLDGKIQHADDPLPLEQLNDLVNASMKEYLSPYKLEQTARLAGTEPINGASYDRDVPPAPTVLLAPAGGRPGTVPTETIQAILDEVYVPPIKPSREDDSVRAEMLPPFTMENLGLRITYPPGGDDGLRKAVLKARAVMWALSTTRESANLADEVAKVRKELNVNLSVMKEGYRKPPDENAFSTMVLKDERDAAELMVACDDALTQLKAAGETGRDKETKRWQANYDFTLARLEAQYAYLFEYQSMLGQMRKQLPDLAPGQNGWKLASSTTLKGDSQGKKLAKDSAKQLEKVIKDNPGTPWEVLAKREKLTALGLEWQGAKNE